ncbi:MULTISPECIES: septation ring formation regulator EzrA [Furfurilactobacillus]|nr:septation ring formation regulator EzrA [Furfurilactobacillus milii]
MVQVLIGIIILAIILFGAVFAFQKITGRRIQALKDRREDLRQLHVDKQVETGHQLSLTGQSLTAFNGLTDEYQSVETKTLPRVDQVINQLMVDARGINFVKTRNELQQATDLLDEATDKLMHVQGGLEALKKVDSDHRAAVNQLEKKYQDLRKVLLSQNLSFGPSIDKLEHNLAELEDQFDEFTNLSQQGDHVAAQKVLDQLTEGTDDLDHLIDTIPPLYRDLKSGFSDQLNDIVDGYQQMTSQNFVFGNVDIPGQVNRIKGEIQTANQHLSDLDVATTTADNHNIEVQIDDLYAVLEKEVKAKPEVDDQNEELQAFLAHAKQQNRALQVELDRLGQSYVLNHGELDNAQTLATEIEKIEEYYRTDVNALATHTDSYSNIQQHQLDQLQALTQIEQQQRQINDGIKGLGAQEQKARQRFQQFDNQMHTIKRQLESLNLPGLPKDYLDYFYVVSDEVEKLGGALSQTQINMEDVTKQLVMIQADLATLTEKSNDVRDSAVLAEQLLQYANRYRNSDEEMVAASQRAQQLFDRDYKYSESLETIANALEKIEPGAYKRIEDSYYGNQPETPTSQA